MKKQVNKTHYDFLKYVSRARWNSFYSQIEEVLDTDGKSVLEVGVGTGVGGNV
jgi:CRISPR/Cas system CSM-associated protein Csm5 (group 7 of RAMP superfamily)